ncbi:MAG: methylmalonyl-CoA mutase, partial [Bryobacteraceae bacterium]|nr:methylmalonyl-CoA mutase [Bryobacteraceae bacterium]
FAPRLSFFFNSHSDFFEEIAKFRAARRLYAKIMRDRFGAKNPKSQMLRFHSQTSGATLTAQQPDVNVVRVALQALAAVLGGTQSLHTNGRDEALSLPTAESASLALRTQQIIAYETGITQAVDPVGGSEYVERLTDEIEEAARRYIEQIDALGGTLAAIERGYIQTEIQSAAYDFQKQVESGEQIVVGVNRFQIPENRSIPIFRLDPALERQQVERLREVRASRSTSEVESRLAALEEAARGTENLMPRIIACCDAWVTVGEISDRLRAVYGEYREVLN